MASKLVLWMVLSCLVLGAFGMDAEMAELAKMLRESCVDETGVDVGLIDKVNAGADLMQDNKLKCYIKCVMETAGMMSGGDVDVEAVIAVLPEELKKHANTMRSCGTQKGTDDCDTAFKTQECWQKGNKQDFFLI
ncbi:general odorant-binding protein 69a-like [Bicyclus anynana]|uniref:General odorant-binding protein 69a-like n=1 Tax=Bicyclus anynana TaxID=110368 RepID=A0A6J1NYC2_BICAN|nr:general odorant-binding protein 69a-like [Bicyclus anynana]